MTTMKGYDISEWQQDIPQDGDFLMMRSSYGIGFKDKKLDSHLSAWGKTGKPYGFYHYSYPVEILKDGHTPEEEADYFISVVKDHIGKAILALDWEGTALSVDFSYAIRFMDRVYRQTGVKPLLYCSSNTLSICSKALQRDYGLWVAHWNTETPVIAPWPFYVLWQYTDQPIDCDIFNGDPSVWEAYARVQEVEIEEEEEEAANPGQIVVNVLQSLFGNKK